MRLSVALVADLLLVTVSLLAAAGWVFSREAIAGLAPMQYLALRFLATSIIVAGVAPTKVRQLDRGQWIRALLTGGILGAQTLVWVVGLSLSENMGLGSFIMSLGFLLVPVVGWLFFRQTTALITWLALGVATLGLALLLIANNMELHLADAFFLGSALIYAFYFNVNGRFARRIPAIPLTAVQMLAAGCVTLIASLLLEPFSFEGFPQVWGWFIAAVLLATALRFFLLVKAQSSAPEAHAAVIMTLEPMWVVLFGLILYGESMTGLQWLGCGCIFLSLFMGALAGVWRRRKIKYAQA